MIPTATSSQFPISFSRVAWSILDCARRTSTFLSCAFREQEDGQATLPILLRLSRALREQGDRPSYPSLFSAARLYLHRLRAENEQLTGHVRMD